MKTTGVPPTLLVRLAAIAEDVDDEETAEWYKQAAVVGLPPLPVVGTGGFPAGVCQQNGRDFETESVPCVVMIR